MKKARKNEFTEGHGGGSSVCMLCTPCEACAMADINQAGIQGRFQ